TTILIDKQALLNANELIDILNEEEVTSIHAVPGLLNLLVEDGFYEKHYYKKLKRAVSAGEPLPESLLEKWHSKIRTPLFNYYGPTETSVYVLGYQTKQGDDVIQIGKPLP
ncbi:MAG: AMP-binding protein, partial [bacterium]